MKTIANFLAESKVYYLATNGECTPDVRPMGIAIPHNEKLYFIAAKSMNVHNQLQNDGKVSISAHNGEKFLRLYGTAILDDSEDTVNTFLKMDEKIANMFPSEVMAPYYLSDVTASICSFTEAAEVHKF
jgi:uncharacterized pyridoxamine 5'-phosphate oxidase family protein